MSSDFVKDKIVKSLELLASPAAKQQEHLERLGSAPSADELALELKNSSSCYQLPSETELFPRNKRPPSALSAT
jgi:hypothetical protein